MPSAKEAAQELLGVSHFLVSLRASKDIQNVIIKAYDKAEIKSISREKYSNASQSSLSLSKMFLMDLDLGLQGNHPCHSYLRLYKKTFLQDVEQEAELLQGLLGIYIEFHLSLKCLWHEFS